MQKKDFRGSELLGAKDSDKLISKKLDSLAHKPERSKRFILPRLNELILLSRKEFGKEKEKENKQIDCHSSIHSFDRRCFNYRFHMGRRRRKIMAGMK